MFNIFKKKETEKENNHLSITAVACLLIHSAKIDENYTDKEKKIIKDAIIEMGGESENIDKIMQEAEEKEKDSNQILGFTREIKNIKEPKICLLNIGHERIKGHEVIKEAATLLEQSDLNYIGFIEGNYIVEDYADVVVTDGFTGNIAVKTMEGSIKMLNGFISDAFNSNSYNKTASFLAKPAINEFKARIDPRRFNGGLLLGLNGIVVKSHGASDSFGFYHALLSAIDEVEKDILKKLILAS